MRDDLNNGCEGDYKSRARISNDLNINNTPLLSIYNLAGQKRLLVECLLLLAYIGLSAMATEWCQAIDEINIVSGKILIIYIFLALFFL